MTTIEGHIDPRFQAVREALAANFADRGEIGAAVCVVIDDTVVVDVWGGMADPRTQRVWRRDTLVNAFSVGKGMLATCVASLDIDPAATVASIWPEFAQAGKDAVTVADLLAHQAGLPAVRRRLPPGTQLLWEAMCEALAGEEPWWEPKTAHGYHVNTFGFLIGEVIRRTCSTSVGQVLAERVAGPLEADVSIGLSPRDQARAAFMVWPADEPALEHEPDLDGDELMRFNAYFNPAGLSGAGVLNTAAWRAAEVPSANCHATARGVARVYQALANGGQADGIRIVDEDVLARAAAERSVGEDRVLQRPTRFGLGFQLTQPERPLGPNPGAFGHFGAGGSVGFCDPQARLAFGYVMNSMGPRWQNPRNSALIDAVYSSL